MTETKRGTFLGTYIYSETEESHDSLNKYFRK